MKTTTKKGFSLIELLITMAVFSVILISVYSMIIHFSNAAKTEQARVTLQQENRFIGSVFMEELKDSGAIMTIADGIMFPEGTATQKIPYFTGIWPLNKNDFPDGVIIATGDPTAVTTLRADHTGTSDILAVKEDFLAASVADPANYSPWKKDDVGMILSDLGYYVFKVAVVDDVNFTIQVREWSSPVYHSGLLNTYADKDKSVTYLDPDTGNNGGMIDYPEGALVMRLSNFAIYMFRERWSEENKREVRQMVRVSDCFGIADVLNDSARVDRSVITENIWDFQMSYIAYENFSTANRTTVPDPQHYYFAGNGTSTTEADLLADLRTWRLKQINVDMVTLTTAYGSTGDISAKPQDVPPLQLGDRPVPDPLPTLGNNAAYVRFGVKITSFSVETMNFNIYRLKVES